MGGRRHGARASVLRAMGVETETDLAARAGDVLPCDYCATPMLFSFDWLGRTLEQCPSRSCPNRHPRIVRPRGGSARRTYTYTRAED